MAKRTKLIASLKTDKFFSISCRRLYLLSVLSCGLYILYWMFQNWKQVKETGVLPQDAKIKPIWRGWVFGPFWMFPLFMRIASAYERKNLFYVGIAAICTLCSFSFIFCGVFSFYFPLLCLSIPLMLLPFQRLINKHTETVKTMWQKNVLIVVAGLLLHFVIPMIFSASPWAFLTDMDAQQRTDFFTASGRIYRYSTVYNEICSKEGYPLNNYLQAFDKAFAEEKGIINKILKKSGLTFELFMQKMLDDEDRNAARETAYADIDYLRQMFILQMLLDAGEISKEEAVWDVSYNQYMTMTEACALIDKHADEVFDLLGIRSQIKSAMKDF